MLEEIENWLRLVTRSGKYSSGLAAELAGHASNGTLHVHMLFDEIAALEGVGPRRSATKPEKRLRGLLSGLWHKHFMQPGFIWQNLINHWANDERLAEALRTVPQEQLAHHLAIQGLSQRAGNATPNGRPALTGEWIVFAKHERCNYYLTVGVHGDDEQIWQRCRACSAQFPELAILREERK